MVPALTRRVIATVAALALVAGACGADNADDAAPGNVGTNLTTPRQPGETTTADGSQTTTRRGTSATSKGSGGNKPNNNGPATSDEGDLRSAALGPPGGFAGMLLAPGPADDLVIDVLVQPGAAVDDAAIAQLRQILASASDKPVAVRGPNTLSASSTVHSADEIRGLADEQGKPEQGKGTAAIHVLYLDGAFTDDSALGVSVRGDVFAIFPDQIAAAATPLVSRSRIERAVTTHELGHLMGLVDLYLDDDRGDKEHPGHSTNARSVMYWAVESDLVTQILGGPPPVDFDAADQADLRKIQGGAPPD